MTAEVEFEEILKALVSLPPEKVTEVRDFVFFLEERYGTPEGLDVSDVWSDEDIRDLTLASLRRAEETAWSD